MQLARQPCREWVSLPGEGPWCACRLQTSMSPPHACALGTGLIVCAAACLCCAAGMLRVRGLLPAGCRMLDTPGVPHAFQLGSWLTAEEMRMILPK